MIEVEGTVASSVSTKSVRRRPPRTSFVVLGNIRMGSLTFA